MNSTTGGWRKTTANTSITATANMNGTRPWRLRSLKLWKRKLLTMSSPGAGGQEGRQPGHTGPKDREVGTHPDPSSDDGRRRRARQALEIPLVGGADLGVESRQTQRRRRGIDEGDEPADLAQPTQSPLIGHEPRGDAEGHHVGQAVVLGPEVALGMGQAGNAPVEPVQDHGGKDGDGGGLEAPLVGRHHGVEAGE